MIKLIMEICSLQSNLLGKVFTIFMKITSSCILASCTISFISLKIVCFTIFTQRIQSMCIIFVRRLTSIPQTLLQGQDLKNFLYPSYQLVIICTVVRPSPSYSSNHLKLSSCLRKQSVHFSIA